MFVMHAVRQGMFLSGVRSTDTADEEDHHGRDGIADLQP